MDTLTNEINRIKIALADLGCNIMYGKNCEDLAKEIIKNTIEKTN